jgi:hypothetical protein
VYGKKRDANAKIGRQETNKKQCANKNCEQEPKLTLADDEVNELNPVLQGRLVLAAWEDLDEEVEAGARDREGRVLGGEHCHEHSAAAVEDGGVVLEDGHCGEEDVVDGSMVQRLNDPFLLDYVAERKGAGSLDGAR